MTASRNSCLHRLLQTLDTVWENLNELIVKHNIQNFPQFAVKFLSGFFNISIHVCLSFSIKVSSFSISFKLCEYDFRASI